MTVCVFIEFFHLFMKKDMNLKVQGSLAVKICLDNGNFRREQSRKSITGFGIMEGRFGYNLKNICRSI